MEAEGFLSILQNQGERAFGQLKKRVPQNQSNKTFDTKALH